MKPEELQRLQNVEQLLQTLLKEFRYHRHTGIDSPLLTGKSFSGSSRPAITDPTDASILYSQSNLQTTVDAVKDILEVLRYYSLINE